ncbi:phage tail terminator family protein [Agathobaculum desmolans]|uniref:phage tail terminator family protein n=1 Tax=Agathobaculum desmolans TaxID=39484 RepID=UPI0004E135D5|nr:hypothetical protein [Agathobaculum desmolans]
MIDVVKEIRNALRVQYPEAQYDVYTESIEQGFAEPCFAIHQLTADITPYPNHRTEIVQHFDVRFFPAGERPREQCRAMAGTLIFLLRQLASLRGTNLSWEITDDVLHFFVSYRQFVREIPPEYLMEILQLETGIDTETEG